MIRSRFSVRTLAIVVTLVCAYFGAWEITAKYGVPEIPSEVRNESASIPEDSALVVFGASPMPFVVMQNEIERLGKSAVMPTRFYLWLFGPKIKLPFESEWK